MFKGSVLALGVAALLALSVPQAEARSTAPSGHGKSHTTLAQADQGVEKGKRVRLNRDNTRNNRRAALRGGERSGEVKGLNTDRRTARSTRTSKSKAKTKPGDQT